MTNNYVRLKEKPGLSASYPACDACLLEVDYEDGDWLCPGCGTSWPGDRMEVDASKATLFEDWSGEEPGGVEVSNALAFWLAGKPVAEQIEMKKHI